MRNEVQLFAGLPRLALTARPRRWQLLATLVLSLWFGLANTARAQVDTYTFAASQGTYVPLTGGTVVPGMAADSYLSPAIPLGFTFVFDGAPFTAVKANANGYLTFNTASTTTTSVTLATAAATVRPLVAPLSDDLDGRPAGSTGVGSYLTTGSPGSQVFTFEWLNWEWRWNATGAVISFQVKLYEGSNRVEFIYRQEATPTNATATLGASIGLAGTGTGQGSYLSVQDASASPAVSSTTENTNINTKPATGQVYAFTPAPPAACPAPRNLAATVTGTSVNLSWGVAGGGGTFQIEYGLQGFTPGSAGGTVLTSTTPTTTITGLQPGTQYQFYVTQICGGTAGNSTRSGPVSFTTTITNDDPCGAIALAVGASCTPTNGTNTGATTTTANGYTNPGTSPNNCGIATAPDDVWFSFTTPATGPAATAVRVQVTGVPASQLRGFSASSCSGPFTQIGCSSTSASVAAPPMDLTGLTPGTVYYVRVSGYGSADPQGAFTICVTNPPTCGDPRTLTFSNVTTTAAQVNFLPGNGQQTFTVTATPTAGGTAVTATGAGSPVQLTGLAPGTPYTVTVRGACPDGSFTATLTGTFSTLIVNDNPCGATQLTLGSDCLAPTSATTVGATNTTANGYTSPGCGPTTATAPRDVWFLFTTAAAGVGSTDVTLTTTGNNANVLRVFSAASCNGPFTAVACKSSTGSTVTAGDLVVSGLMPGTTYYVSVAGYTNTTVQSAFTICVRGNSNCPLPVAPAANNVTSTTADLTWSVASPTPSGSFTIEYGLQGFIPGSPAGRVVTSTSPNVTLSGLTPDSNYCFYVSQNCGTLNGSSQRVGPICFRTDIAQTTNDEPCAALPVGSTPVTATNIGATTTLLNGVVLPACSPSQAPKDVWFTITPSGTSTSLTLTGTAAGMVRLFTLADCVNGPLVPVSCQSAGASNTGFTAPVMFSGLTPNRRYYLAVSGYGSGDTQGSFTIAGTNLLAGRAQAETNALLVYPNPSNSGQLTLRINGQSGAAQASLLNALGQQVLSQGLAGGQAEYSISTRGLAAGVYTLRVKQGNTVLTRKVILE